MRLEAEVGVQLLARDNRSILVSELGAQAFDAWSELVARLEHVQQASTAHGGRTEALACRCPAARCCACCPLLDRYRTAFPNVQLRLNINDGSGNMMRDRNDVPLRLGSLKDSSEGAVSRGACLPGARRYPLAPGDLGEREGSLFRLPDIGRTRPIMLPDEYSSWRAVARIDEGQALVRAATAGLGLIQALWLLVEADLSSGRLVEVLAAYRPPPLELNMVLPASRWLPA